MLRNILLGAGLFATIVAVYLFANPKGGGGPRGEVVLWGTLPEAQMNTVTQAFNPQAKSYAVRYKYVPENEFSQKLLEALASGTGPDSIIAPYKTILAIKDRLYPYPVQEKEF